MSKIIETGMKIRLTSFLSKFNLLSKSQYGFWQGKNTYDAQVDLTEYLWKCLNEKKSLRMGNLQ